MWWIPTTFSSLHCSVKLIEEFALFISEHYRITEYAELQRTQKSYRDQLFVLIVIFFFFSEGVLQWAD